MPSTACSTVDPRKQSFRSPPALTPFSFFSSFSSVFHFGPFQLEQRSACRLALCCLIRSNNAKAVIFGTSPLAFESKLRHHFPRCFRERGGHARVGWTEPKPASKLQHAATHECTHSLTLLASDEPTSVRL